MPNWLSVVPSICGCITAIIMFMSLNDGRRSNQEKSLQRQKEAKIAQRSQDIKIVKYFGAPSMLSAFRHEQSAINKLTKDQKNVARKRLHNISLVLMDKEIERQQAYLGKCLK